MFLTIGYVFSTWRNRWLPARVFVNGAWKEFNEWHPTDTELMNILKTLQPNSKIVWSHRAVDQLET